MHGYQHSEDGTCYNNIINGIGWYTFSHGITCMIRGKIDIITITFSLKLPFLESTHDTCIYLNYNIYGTAMPYMSLNSFRLKSSFSYSFSRKRAENCHWLN